MADQPMARARAETLRLRVELARRSYDIVIGDGILDSAPQLLGLSGASGGSPPGIRKAAIVTDSNVGPLYGERLRHAFRSAGCEAHTVSVAAGEAAKNTGTLEYLWNAFADAGLGRRDLAVALGGGVVGDVTGFAAGTYMRGIPYVQVPTTLLAQVDSSVGGKTALDLPAGKNLAGLFYQPAGVLIDVSTLATLPERQFRAGLVEIIKYGIICDPELFDRLEACGLSNEQLPNPQPSNLNPQTATLIWFIGRSCAIKAQIVAADETEGGLEAAAGCSGQLPKPQASSLESVPGDRRVLNLGHTAAHALEAASGYSEYLHGEAVAWGLRVASRLAVRLGLLGAHDLQRIERLLESAGCLAGRPQVPPERILQFMRRDKKALAGRQVWVLPAAIGSVVVRNDVPDDVVLAVLGEQVDK